MGYGNRAPRSGPAQLALALLLRVAGPVAEREYQAFKDDVVAGWPREGAWRMERGEVEAWLAARGGRT